MTKSMLFIYFKKLKGFESFFSTEIFLLVLSALQDIIWHVMHKRVRNRKKWKVGRGLLPFMFEPPILTSAQSPENATILSTQTFSTTAPDANEQGRKYGS